MGRLETSSALREGHTMKRAEKFMPGRLNAEQKQHFEDKCALTEITFEVAVHEATHAVNAKLCGEVVCQLSGNFIELQGSPSLSTIAAGMVGEHLFGFRPKLKPDL